MPDTPDLKPTPTIEKVEFLRGLKMIIVSGAVPLGDDLLDELDVLSEVDTPAVPLETAFTKLAKKLGGQLDTLRALDDAALDKAVDEAEDALSEDPDDKDAFDHLQEVREDRRVKVNAAREQYQDLIKQLTEAIDLAGRRGTPSDVRVLNVVLGTAEGDHSALRARRRQARLDRIDKRRRDVEDGGFQGTILAAPKSKMLVENPSTPGEFHEIDMSEYGPTLAHKTGELYLFEDGWVRKATTDPGGLTVVEQFDDEDGVTYYKVNVMKESTFLAASKMGAIEELFGGHGGGYTEVVDSGTVKKTSGDETIDERRLVYRVGRHAPGLTLDQLKDRLRKGRISHDAAWAAQSRRTSQFVSEEAYVDAYDKSVKVLVDAIAAGSLPHDGTNYYSSYEVSVNHGAGIGRGFERTLSNNQTSSLPTADPDEFGTIGPSSRKKIPDSDIVQLSDSTLKWSMANFNVSLSGDFTLARFWPQDSSEGGTSVSGGDIKGSHYKGNKGPLVSTGTVTSPDDSETIVKTKTETAYPPTT